VRENKRLESELESKIKQIELLQLSATDVQTEALNLLEENQQLRIVCQKQRENHEKLELKLENQKLKFEMITQKMQNMIDENEELKAKNKRLKQKIGMMKKKGCSIL